MIMPSARRTVARSARVMQRLGLTKHESLHLVVQVIEAAARRLGDDRLTSHGWLHDMHREATYQVSRWHSANLPQWRGCAHAREPIDRPGPSATD